MADREASKHSGLRGLVAGATATMAGLVIVVTTTLILLTTWLHRSNVVLYESLVGVRLAEEAAIFLLSVDRRSGDPVARAAAERELRGHLAEAERHVTSSAERAVMDHAAATVDRYLAGGADPADRGALLDAAHAALSDLADANLAQVAKARADVARWDAMANAIGITTGLSMLAILGVLAVWIRGAVVRPLFALSAVMDRFAAGALDARAPERGAAEIREMARGFNAMASTLARQHRGRAAYIAGVAHDLRNPLAALQVSAALIDPDAPLPSEDRVRKVVSVVRRQITRLNRMVGDLVDASAIEAGHLDLQLSDGDLNDIVRDVTALFADASPIHRIVVLSPGDLLPVRCDPVRIEQALSNLVSNAVKYSPRGGEVRLTVYRDHGEAVVSVTDQGVGIAPEALEHLWEPFRRGGVSTEMIPGVGLGLSVAKRIIDAHGGTITVDSTAERGSTFAIRLPLRGQGDDLAAAPRGASPEDRP